MNKTKFERNNPLQYYHMTRIGKQNIQAKEANFDDQCPLKLWILT